MTEEKNPVNSGNDGKCCDFYERNFDSLPSQSSIYGVTSISGVPEWHNTLLVALTKGKIYACEYKPTSSNSDLRGVSREISFTYIPGKCCLIAIDSFYCAARGLVVGVTLCNVSSNEFFLNIYCNYGDEVNKDQEWNLNNVAQNCRSLDLNFVPYQLTHCKVQCPVDKEHRTVFILLGGDKVFHVYAQGIDDALFSEVPAAEYFNELKEGKETPMFLEIQNLAGNKRISIIGYETGKITGFLVDKVTNKTISSWSVQHDSPIAEIRLFSINMLKEETDNIGVYHACVVSTREPTLIYRNILANEFSNPLILSQTSQYDCVTCCEILHNRSSNLNQILVGTYGQKVLAFNLDDDINGIVPFTTILPCWTRDFTHPILQVKLSDMTGDGIEELVVVTTGGVHMLQYDLNAILQKLKGVMQHMK